MHYHRSRGLGQLVRARNINSIGDLARLTEVDIDNLPIRAPKVDTVKKVLERFAQTQRGKKGRVSDKVAAGGDNQSADGTPGVTTADVIDLDRAQTTEEGKIEKGIEVISNEMRHLQGDPYAICRWCSSRLLARASAF